MNLQRAAYAALKYANDVKAAKRAAERGSLDPVARRLGRRAYGKLSGHLARRIFG